MSEALRRHHCGLTPALHSSDLELERDKGVDSPDALMSQEESQLSGKQLAFLQQLGLRDKQINADTRLHLMS